jgi:hypothetical protein
MERDERGGGTAAQGGALGDLGDDADGGVPGAASWYEQNASVGADLGGQGNGHAGKHHGSIERNQGKGWHASTLRSMIDDVNY